MYRSSILRTLLSVLNGAVSRLPIFAFWYTLAMMQSSLSFACGHHDKARSKPLVQLRNPAANVEQPANGWTAFVESNLAASGGLHWDFEHCITLTPPNSHVHGSLDTIGILQVSLYLLIHLASDLFVNVEDLFRHSNNAATVAVSWNVTLVPPLAVIDQEEPAIVSLAHALLVHVSALLDDNGSHEWMPPLQYTMQFATKLHVRYPKPFAVAYNKSANFRRVMLPQPELLTGAVIRHYSTARTSLSAEFYVLVSLGIVDCGWTPISIRIRQVDDSTQDHCRSTGHVEGYYGCVYLGVDLKSKDNR
jgi:hypothetical protein